MTIMFMFLTSLALAEDEAAPAAEEVPAAEEAAPAEEATPADEAAPADEATDEAPAEGDEAAAEEGDEAPAEEAKAEVPEVEVPQTDEEAIADVKASVDALKNGQWATFVILLFGLLGFGWNRFKGLKEGSKDEAKSE